MEDGGKKRQRVDSLSGKKVVYQPYDDKLESDDEAGERNRVGRVDMSLYAEAEHVGYDVEGVRVAKVMALQESQMDSLLRNADDPDAWRTILDPKNQTRVKISDRDLEIIQRIKEGRLGVEQDIDEADFQLEIPWTETEQPLVERFTPLSHFRSVAGDERRIRRFMNLIRKGLFYRRATAQELKLRPKDVWGESVMCVVVNYKGQERSIAPALPPPKPTPPGHAESYNPPPEYLFDDEELAAWLAKPEEERVGTLQPQRFDSMRRIPGYENNIIEAYDRCLSLYLCPRALREKFANERADDMLPQVPTLDNFRPFPRTLGVVVKDHGSPVVSLSFCQQSGELAAGCADGSLVLHNVASHPFFLQEFYAKTHSTSGAYAVTSLQFHPILPLLIFNRGVYLFILLLRRPQTSVADLSSLVQKYWTNEDPLTKSAKDQSPVEPHLQQYVHAIDSMRIGEATVPECSLNNQPTRIGDWRAFKSEVFFNPKFNAEDSHARRAAAITAVRNKAELEAQAEAQAEAEAEAETDAEGEGEKVKSKSGVHVGLAAAKSKDLFAEIFDYHLGDDEGEVDTEGEDEEADGHLKLVKKDWRETLKFLHLLSTHNKYVVAGYVVALGAKSNSVSVHKKGAYIATSATNVPQASAQCMLHHLKRKRSVAPLKSRKSHATRTVQSVSFHPHKPCLYVGYTRGVKLYSLVPRTRTHIEELSKNAQGETMSQVVRSFRGGDRAMAMEISPCGAHILRATIDGKFQWYDTEFSSSPFKTVAVHELGGQVTSLHYHPHLPLIAAGTSDSFVQLFHAREDDMSEVAINPLVRLADKDSRIASVAWSPNNHWLASGHSNGRIIIWV